MNARNAFWLVGSICAALFVVAGLVCLRIYVLNPYRVPTAGMVPTIRPGDLVWGYKLAYSVPGDVQRYDVVVHRAKLPDGRIQVYAKRVIGLPGDAIRTEGRRVFLNGAELPQEFLRTDGPFSLFNEVAGGARHQIALQLASSPASHPPDVDLMVPADSFFLLGDNRMNSFDSRYTGCVSWIDIIGKIIWPVR